MDKLETSSNTFELPWGAIMLYSLLQGGVAAITGLRGMSSNPALDLDISLEPCLMATHMQHMHPPQTIPFHHTISLTDSCAPRDGSHTRACTSRRGFCLLRQIALSIQWRRHTTDAATPRCVRLLFAKVHILAPSPFVEGQDSG